jgi:hypothetical protein
MRLQPNRRAGDRLRQSLGGRAHQIQLEVRGGSRADNACLRQPVRKDANCRDRPSFEANSPCFPATLPDNRSPSPTILTAN